MPIFIEMLCYAMLKQFTIPNTLAVAFQGTNPQPPKLTIDKSPLRLYV